MADSITSRRIDITRLKSSDYFSSLLEEAAKASLLSDETVSRIKSDVIALIASRCVLFTKNKSSSLPVETAQIITDSVVHTIGVFLKTFIFPEQAVSYLENEKNSVFRAFCLGLKATEKSFEYSKKRYIRLKRHLIKTPNEFYNDTILSGITAFFRTYSPEYASHIIGITADYRPLLPIPDVSGMEFMEKYIKYLYFENSFLDIIGEEAVHRAMYSYDTSYDTQLINIFETVILACFVPLSEGKVIDGLKPNRSYRASLCGKLELIYGFDIDGYVDALLQKICYKTDTDETLTEYILKCAPVITDKINAYVKRGMTESLFVSKPPVVESTKYIDGEQMNDSDYEKLISEVNGCNDDDEKIKIIFASVRSVADLADVIRDAYLGENVIKDIKSRLSSEEKELLESFI